MRAAVFEVKEGKIAISPTMCCITQTRDGSVRIFGGNSIWGETAETTFDGAVAELDAALRDDGFDLDDDDEGFDPLGLADGLPE
jgi:hypothetical protein